VKLSNGLTRFSTKEERPAINGWQSSYRKS